MKRLMSGNAALGEAAVLSGCTCYFGYPITPQNELTEYMAKRMAEVGGVFVQSESEIAAINMVLGASAAGARAMTSSSGPGISLKQEGISYLAADELPAVVVNVVRGGPGMGNISPSQSDYLQATRGGGHGDYRTIVLAPSSVQELIEVVPLAFDLADKYRNPVLILGDGMLGQMMEPVDFAGLKRPPDYEKDYILDGAKGRPARKVHSLIFDTKLQEEHNWKLFRKFQLMEQNEVRYDTYLAEDAEMIVVAYGMGARIVKGAIKRLRDEGLKVGMLRPITLWPFPAKALQELATTVRDFFVFEMSAGQMVEDVRLALSGRARVHFYGRPGGVIPTPIELYRIISRHYYQAQYDNKPEAEKRAKP
jgi:2-oxoglutarate ferredoxin oxidoreductase subunit alpha